MKFKTILATVLLLLLCTLAYPKYLPIPKDTTESIGEGINYDEVARIPDTDTCIVQNIIHVEDQTLGTMFLLYLLTVFITVVIIQLLKRYVPFLCIGGIDAQVLSWVIGIITTLTVIAIWAPVVPWYAVTVTGFIVSLSSNGIYDTGLVIYIQRVLSSRRK